MALQQSWLAAVLDVFPIQSCILSKCQSTQKTLTLENLKLSPVTIHDDQLSSTVITPRSIRPSNTVKSKISVTIDR